MSQRSPKPQEVETFAQEYVLTGSYFDAFKKTFPKTKSSDSSIRKSACRVASHPKVIKRINELQDRPGEKTHKHLITFEEKQRLLKVIIDEGLKFKIDKYGNKLPIDLKACISAIETLNKMDGHNAPTRIESDGSVNLIIQKRVVSTGVTVDGEVLKSTKQKTTTRQTTKTITPIKDVN